VEVAQLSGGLIALEEPVNAARRVADRIDADRHRFDTSPVTSQRVHSPRHLGGDHRAGCGAGGVQEGHGDCLAFQVGGSNCAALLVPQSERRECHSFRRLTPAEIAATVAAGEQEPDGDRQRCDEDAEDDRDPHPLDDADARSRRLPLGSLGAPRELGSLGPKAKQLGVDLRQRRRRVGSRDT
jgi:hypothetical protein